jgi:hypothetical protein
MTATEAAHVRRRSKQTYGVLMKKARIAVGGRAKYPIELEGACGVWLV